MINSILGILETLGYPVRLRQSFLADTDELPETFILYEETGTEDLLVYDNDEAGVLWKWTVSVLSTTPQKTVEIAKEIKQKLKSSPFTMRGLGSGYIATGTKYTGRNIYIEGRERTDGTER